MESGKTNKDYVKGNKVVPFIPWKYSPEQGGVYGWM